MKTDGGPAFPMPSFLDAEGSNIWGLSKRELFAIMALQRVDLLGGYPEDDMIRTAAWAVKMADILLNELEQTK